jgi:hypothetical protein
VRYWDSRGAAGDLFEDRAALPRIGLPAEPPKAYFAGKWSERHRLNVPGPFYGAETDTCCCGPVEAPRNVLVDEDGEEFIWRQPKNAEQLRAVLSAAWCDPFSGYGWDGDAQWTPEDVRQWWVERDQVSEWIDRRLGSDHFIDGEATSLAEFRNYFDASLEGDLRVYLFWLEQRQSPLESDALPRLAR